MALSQVNFKLFQNLFHLLACSRERSTRYSDGFCMIFLAPFLDRLMMSMSTVFFRTNSVSLDEHPPK